MTGLPMKEKSKVMNKKGSYAILASILFSSMMILAAAAVHAAGESAISATVENFGPLWGRSILAEYDRNLKDRYGIFAYSGNKLQVEEKLKNYMLYSCRDKKYISFESCECNLDEYELVRPENFFEQIKDAVAYDAKPMPIKYSAEKNTEGGGSNEAFSKRYIKNQRIIKTLPSRGKSGGVGVSALVEKIKESKSIGDLLNDSAENIYIFRFFKDCMNDRNLGETYFKNEIEYILTGRLDDSDSKQKVKNQLILLRNALNLTYLYSCSEKRNAALAAAELIMPEAPLLTQALIMDGWAFMEARNDLKLLYAGKTAPLIKKDENWAVSLENLLSAEYGCDTDGKPVSGSESDGEPSDYVVPRKLEGKTYEDYLKIFVASLPRETKKLRMLDLMQINMKYLYCEYFLISDYFIGLRYSVNINGKIHEFNEKY